MIAKMKKQNTSCFYSDFLYNHLEFSLLKFKTVKPCKVQGMIFLLRTNFPYTKCMIKFE